MKIRYVQCCLCKEEVPLTHPLTNECPRCGALYNYYGDKLEDGVDRLNHPCHDGKNF